MNCELVLKNIREHLSTYIENSEIESLIIGVSGGIDSAICCALAEPVCKKFQIPLIGRSLPIMSNKPDEIDRAKKVGEAFCDDFKEVSLEELYINIRDFIYDNEIPCGDSKRESIKCGNLKARTRMIYLYNLAFTYKGMVLSTDNLTEYNLGFWTLHGDVGDYGMIQNLWKTEVYELTNYLIKLFQKEELFKTFCKGEALKLCYDAVPTDGLGITNSDLDQLGANSYQEVDTVLKDWVVNTRVKDPTHPVFRRHLNSMFKRNNPYNISRENLFKK
ncbi:MAG TPA: NAD(+) synthase [Caldisericia bacterium]|jgi:NAD+ synthetase|nr:NAD(+) synthase [Caldisericia bacterium]